MTARNTDINLVVRARTEGEKAIAGLDAALEGLLSTAHNGNVDIGELGKTLGALDKAAATIAGSMDKAGSAMDRQRAKLAEANQEYAALIKQQAEAQRVLGELEQLAHGDAQPKEFKEQLGAARAEVERLGVAVSNTFNRIATQSAQINGAQSSLLKLASTSTVVAEGQAVAEARIELTTQALREQAEAAETLSDVQRRINNLTGVDREQQPDAASRASLLLEADQLYAEGQARAYQAAAIAHQMFEARVKEGAQALRDEEREAQRLQDASDMRAASAAHQMFEARVKEGAQALRDEAEAAERIDAEVAALRAALDPLAAIQERFNVALERYKALAAAGKISVDELAAAETHLAAEAEKARNALQHDSDKAKIGLFGLKPYEFQNLSYQINDVVTGLASGQRATQVIAQQGGQILQLFPKVAGNIIGAFTNPAILTAVATAAAIALAIKKAADDAERLRTYTAATTFRADGSSYDPNKLADAQEALEHLGAKSTDAMAAMKAFLNDGVDPSRLEQFGRIALETSKVLGIDLADAAKQIAAAFTGGYKSVADLDDKLNFLTASEREHIRTLFESGNAEAARTEALNAYTRQADAAAAKQRGPWGDAAHSLAKAWDSLIGWIADSAPIKVTIGVLNELAGVVKDIADGITSVTGGDKSGGNAAAANIAKVQDQIKSLNKDIADYQAAIAKNPAAPVAATLQHLVDESKRQLAAAQEQLGKLEKSAPDTVNGDPNSPEAKRRQDQLTDISREDELQRLRDAGRLRLLTSAEKARREELAGQVAAKDAADAVVAAAERRRAVAHETADIEKESIERTRRAEAEREKSIKEFEGRVVGAEGGAGKNPHGSAAGYGQFTEGTWMAEFAKVFPEQSRTLSQQQILALRQNEQVARAIIDEYARENAKFLESFGAKVSAGNLYLTHFLGQAGAKAVLQAPADTPVDQIIRRQPNAAKVLSGNQGYLRTDGGKGRYRTAGELQSFLANRVGDTGVAQTQGQVEINNLLEQAKIHQDAFNESVRHGNEDRQDAIKALREETGLYGTALLAAERRKAITDAERELRQKAEDANKNLKPGETPVVVTPEQIGTARDAAAAYFDLAHAKEALNAKLADVQRPLDDLTGERDNLKQRAEFLRSIGENSQADAVDKQVLALTGDIGKAYDALIQFYEALTPDQRVQLGILDQGQLDNIINKLKVAKSTGQEWGKVLGLDAKQVASAFASSATTAITNFIEKVSSGKNVFKSLGQSVQEFAANFVQSIAQIIVQMLALQATMAVLRALGVPIPTGSFGIGVHHSGGIAGQAGGARREANTAMLSTAMRFHTGGIVGLGPDEVPAILQQGEEVLTKGDPRHRANGGMAGGATAAPGSIKVVNVSNAADTLAEALADEQGQRVILNHVNRNQRAWKTALGG